MIRSAVFDEDIIEYFDEKDLFVFNDNKRRCASQSPRYSQSLTRQLVAKSILHRIYSCRVV